MKHDAEELVRNYFKEEELEMVDTREFIKELKPTIIHKCAVIKSKDKNIIETTVFVLGCIVTFLGGLYLLFPEVIDYSDEIIQFTLSALLVGLLLAGINLTIRELSTENFSNKTNKLRGKLL